MGNLAMGKCEDRQIKSCIIETNCKHFEGGYGRLPLGDLYTCREIFKEHTSLKKLIPKHFFTSLFNNLLIKDLVTLGNLLSTKFLKPRR
jgi:hypothetical protein